MALNYTTFVSTLANMLVIPANDPNYISVLPNIIDDAEQRIYRELDLLDTVIRDSSGSLTPNTRTFTFPQHFVVSQGINIFYDQNGITKRKQLIPTTRDFIDAVYGDSVFEGDPGTTPLPQYYAMITDQTIIVGPSPSQSYQVEVIGTVRPTPLSVSNPTTYLTNYLPDLFLAEALIFGYGFLKDFGATTDDPQASASWNKHYQDLWQSANVEENRKKYAAQGWTSMQPAPLATPPRT